MYKQAEDLVVKVVPIMHMEYPFFYSDHAYTGTKQLSMEQAKRMNEAIKSCKVLKKPLPPSVTKIIKMLTSTRNAQQKGEDGFTE
jgi:23S rRNA A2030 N6-methylase RlmJ